MAGLDFLVAELAALEAQSQLRATPAPGDEVGLRNLCSNDYLGLARRHPAAQAPGGAGASALVSGHGTAHRDAEAALGGWLEAEAVLMFSSGYAANVGTIAALLGSADAVFSDALNHASIIDGCRLSGARIHTFPHRDLGALARLLEATAGQFRRRLVVTESYFSMDGDCAELSGLMELVVRHEAMWMVDEAHALGVFGPRGRGLCAAQGVRPDILVGTLGKSFGLQGAFVAGRRELRSWLWNRARSFVFSTALSPVLAAEAAERVTLVAEADEERGRIARLSSRLRARIVEVGGVLPSSSEGPIVPWLLGSEERALRGAEVLRGEGFLVRAIRPPTVPNGSSRLRFTVDAGLRVDEAERLMLAVGRVAQVVGRG